MGGLLAARVLGDVLDEVVKAWHDEPPLGPPGVDQLLGRQTRSGPQVGQVPLRGARPDAHEGGRLGH